jgi:S1-C subfamily serine protease
MFKRLAFLFLPMLLAMPQATQARDAARIAEASRSIVMIEAEMPAGRALRGAGFVYDSSGRIATAFHVVEGATTINLQFRDGRRATAVVAAKDAPFDLALLKANTPVIAPPLLIEPRAPEIGAPVLAVGNPFGHSFSVSSGILSGHDRTYDPLSPHGFLQHDAALNPGSSGGPLLDAQNRVIGINAAIPNGRRSDVGVGFAIPGAVAARVLARLATAGALRHGYLGARLRLLDPALARALGETAGAVAIEEVEEGGAAQRAGARPGDILRRIDGKPLRDLRQVSEAVAGSEPGVIVVLQGVRNGQSLRLEVTLGEREELAAPSMPPPAAAALLETGIVIAAGGDAVVKSLTDDSPAAAAGIKAGDMILAIGGQQIASAKEARMALDKHGAGDLALLIRRAGLGARYVVVSGRQDALSGSALEGNREIETSLPF